MMVTMQVMEKRPGGRRGELRPGAVAALPLLPGNVAWGIAFGAAAAAAGLRLPGSIAMSGIAFSGTAQLAALALLRQPLPTIFLSSLLVSLRFVPMALSLVRLLPGTPRWRRVVAACCLADASFALVAAERVRSASGVVGMFLPMYVAWVGGTLVGAVAAPLLPPTLLSASDGLIAVIFAVLTVEVCTGRPQAAVAIGAAAAAAAAMLVVPGAVALPVAAIAVAAAAIAVRR
jgi:predicted branched-subunit amino acid permease